MTKVPIIGTFRGRFSNHWKIPAAAAVLAHTLGAFAGELSWTTNRHDQGRTLASSALEADHVRAALAPLRKASQQWNIAWPSSPDTNAVARLRAGLCALLRETLADYPFPETTADSPESSIRASADVFNQEFKDLVKADPSMAQRYEAKVELKPVLATSNLVVATAGAYVYSGGAHGVSPVFHRVFDARTGRPIAFDEAFAPESRSNLLAALTVRFRGDKSLGPSQTLKDAGLYENALVLTSNYFADATGVGFTYPEYAIAPRSGGEIRIHLSYALVRDLLATGTAVRAEADERLAGRTPL